MVSEIDIKSKLTAILSEMKKQTELVGYYPEWFLSFEEEMAQIKEFIEDANEYSIADESLAANLEKVPFLLSGKTAGFPYRGRFDHGI